MVSRSTTDLIEDIARVRDTCLALTHSNESKDPFFCIQKIGQPSYFVTVFSAERFKEARRSYESAIAVLQEANMYMIEPSRMSDMLSIYCMT